MAKASNKVFSGVFWVYLENISAQLVSFVVTIILARLIAPNLYGTIALVSVFISLAEVFVKSSFSTALIQKKDADQLDYDTMFWFNLAVAFVLYVLLFFLSPAIANIFNNHELVLVLRVLSISVPLSALNSVQLAYVSSKMVFKKSFFSTSAGTLLSGILSVIFAYLGFGLWALVLQRLLTVLFNTVFLRIVIDWKLKFQFSFGRLKPMLSFGWKILFTGFMFTAYHELRSLVIGKRYTAADLGYYDRGYSFPRFIASNIDTTINRVLFPALSKKQDEASSLVSKTRRAAKTSAYIMTPILWGLASISQPLVLVLLGEKWLPCVPYVQIMCLVWWLQPTQSCSSQAIKAIGRSDVYLKVEICSKIIGLVLLAFAVFVIDSVFAIALTMLIGQAIGVLLNGWASAHYIGYKMNHQLVDLLMPALLSVPIVLISYGASLIVPNPYICLFIQILGGIVIYIVLSWSLKIDSFNYIRNIVLRKERNE